MVRSEVDQLDFSSVLARIAERERQIRLNQYVRIKAKGIIENYGRKKPRIPKSDFSEVQVPVRVFGVNGIITVVYDRFHYDSSRKAINIHLSLNGKDTHLYTIEGPRPVIDSLSRSPADIPQLEFALSLLGYVQSYCEQKSATNTETSAGKVHTGSSQ